MSANGEACAELMQTRIDIPPFQYQAVPPDPGMQPASRVDRAHWHRRDAILTAHAVLTSSKFGNPTSAEAHNRLLDIARFIYYGDRSQVIRVEKGRDVG